MLKLDTLQKRLSRFSAIQFRKSGGDAIDFFDELGRIDRLVDLDDEFADMDIPEPKTSIFGGDHLVVGMIARTPGLFFDDAAASTVKFQEKFHYLEL